MEVAVPSASGWRKGRVLLIESSQLGFRSSGVFLSLGSDYFQEWPAVGGKKHHRCSEWAALSPHTHPFHLQQAGMSLPV